MSAANSTIMADARASLVSDARNILSGKYKKPAEILTLAKSLKEVREFGYARRILARARKDPAIHTDPKRLAIFQQSALCTYKDPDLSADRKLDRALDILREVENLETTTDPETLGLAGAIYKRKWEVDNQRAQLERSISYYLRGHAASEATDLEADQGYNGINVAYILDLLAHKQEEEADSAKAPAGSLERQRIEQLRRQAKEIRELIVKKVIPLIERRDKKWLDENQHNWLQGKWWFYSTVAEAYFGLGRYDEANYDEAVEWLEKGRAAMKDVEVVRGVKGVPQWEFESTSRQLASIALLQAGSWLTVADMKEKPAWRALEKFLGRDAAPVYSAFYGKIGLGLSGGGFRASLFHIGVLAKLAELDVLRRVEVLSCVSGGSIVGAHYYLEVRKLLQSKPDADITREDYVELVGRVADDFLKGVQRNVRTRVAAGIWKNLQMIFGTKRAPLRWIFGGPYSRTMRAGDLYEEEIFSLVKDGTGRKERRWLNDLRIRPMVGKEPAGDPVLDRDFSPKRGNWLRESKVPILILNAATLNTGHSWHFTANYMGEPPAGIDSEIDGNDRFRRLYYEDAPDAHKCVRLGHAVAASACVQGVFEPLALEGLYPERIVRLVDGGTCDNQGVGGLLEQDCNVLLISDGSGQMESEKEPSNGLLGVPLRSTSILQARIRGAQYQDLSERRRSRLLRGLMFVHLKADLDVDPVDWVDCPDPYDADDDDARPASRKGRLTRYGVSKEIQQLLASIRTDLDSFSDVEAYALMTSGYRQAEYALCEAQCVEGFGADCGREGWKFLEVEEGMRGAGKKYQHVKRLLGVSDTLAFKILKLRKLALALAVALAAFALVLIYYIVRTVIESAVLVGDKVPFMQAAGIAIRDRGLELLNIGQTKTGLAVLLVAAAAVSLPLIAFIRKKGRGEAFVRVALSLAGVIGALVARVHLLIFDWWFLREGSLKKYLRETRKEGAPCGGKPSKTPRHAAPGPPTPAPSRAGVAREVRADAGAAETVKAGAPAGPLPPSPAHVGAARAEPPGGNGHTPKEGGNGGTRPERAPDGAPDAGDIHDPDARQE